MKGGKRRPNAKKLQQPITKNEVLQTLGTIEHDVYDASSRSVTMELPESLRQPKAEKTGERYSLPALEKASLNAFFFF